MHFGGHVLPLSLQLERIRPLPNSPTALKLHTWE